eukprot:Lithocolla_globosa_v1_NODE_322_length_4485_cov_1721.272460.p2 type:complete len:390 gc:universal NODE_322_length_4485_cov_1721.272460:2476-3645(+)
MKKINAGNLTYPQYYILEADIVTNKKLCSAVLPRRSEKGGLIWDLQDIEHGVYNSIDIQRAISKGYQISKIHKMMYWRNDKGSPIFKDYIEQVFEMKKLAKNKNPVKYQISKLLMNSLYGKMLQKPIVTKKELVRNLAQLNKIRSLGTIENLNFINQNLLHVTYTPFEVDSEVTKPSYIGSLILANSRLWMDKYIDIVNGYHSLDDSFYRTDTDSLIVHSKHLDNLKPHLGKELGQLDFDIDGKIIRFAEPAPKLYICEYICNKTGEIKKHVKSKGFSRAHQDKLEWSDYERMLFGNQEDKDSIDLLDSRGRKEGQIDYHDNSVTMIMNDKLKKIGFNLNSKQIEKGYSVSNIVSENQIRSLNKTVWNKRVRIEGNNELASYPIGYQYN